MQFATERFTSAQRTQIERVCQAQDVILDRGRLMLRGFAAADIVDAILFLGTKTLSLTTEHPGLARQSQSRTRHVCVSQHRNSHPHRGRY